MNQTEFIKRTIPRTYEVTLFETHNYSLPSELSFDYSNKILPKLVSLSIYIAVYDRRDQCLFDKFSLISSGSNEGKINQTLEIRD